MTRNRFPAPPLPAPGRPRAWWRPPASRSALAWHAARAAEAHRGPLLLVARDSHAAHQLEDRKSTRLNSSHVKISYAVFCLKKKKKTKNKHTSRKKQTH